MKSIYPIAIAVILIILSGCNLHLEEPLGKEITDTSEISNLVGSWLIYPESNDEKVGSCEIHLSDSENFEYQIVMSNGEHFNFVLRASDKDESYYANFKLSENYYTPYRLRLVEDTIYIWGPNDDGFKSLIDNKKIRGESRKSWGPNSRLYEHYISSSNEELLEYFEEHGINELFEWEKPIILRKK